MEQARGARAGALVPTPPADLIQIGPGQAGRLIVLLPYTPERVEKIKAVAGRRWHPDGRYWTVPHTDGALAHLLNLFKGGPVEVDGSLRRAAAIPDGRPNVRREPVPALGILDEVRQAIAARHYSRSTEQAYVAWVRRFISFNGKRHPIEMGEREVNQFLTHLATAERVAASTQNHAGVLSRVPLAHYAARQGSMVPAGVGHSEDEDPGQGGDARRESSSLCRVRPTCEGC